MEAFNVAKEQRSRRDRPGSARTVTVTTHHHQPLTPCTCTFFGTSVNLLGSATTFTPAEGERLVLGRPLGKSDILDPNLSCVLEPKTSNRWDQEGFIPAPRLHHQSPRLLLT